MIKTLSKYIVEIPYKNPTTNVVASSYTLKLYVWIGESSSIPIDPTYEITKPNTLLTDSYDVVNLSSIINDFIMFDYNPSSGIGIVDSYNQAWVKWQIYYSDTPLVSSVEFMDLAIKGYGYYLDNTNPQPPLNRVLIEQDEYKVGRRSRFIIPILLSDTVNYGNVTIRSFPLGDVNLNLPTGLISNSDEIIKYINIDVRNISLSEEYVEVTFNGVKKTLLIVDECRYEVLDVAFQNKHGAVQIFSMFKAKSETTKINKSQYENSIFYQYGINSNSKISINTGFIDESMNEAVRQLLLSERTWVVNESRAVPLILENNSLEYKTRVNDRLINYKIDMKYAFNDIY
jgi:hypothetical protein